MSTTNACAACGREADDLKKCAGCLEVKYCNRMCQQAHYSAHKAQCKKRQAELHDEALFKQPEMEDCPICFLPISVGVTLTSYHSCCGKTICSGCCFAVRKESAMEGKPQTCAFCRTPYPDTDREVLQRANDRIEKQDDADACNALGWDYHNGACGLRQDREKAFALWLKASENGSPEAHNNVATAYFEGKAVPQDETKAFLYMERAAMAGNALSRHNLAAIELNQRQNLDRAIRHLMIAVRSGFEEALSTVKRLFMRGKVSKGVYETALRAYMEAGDMLKSEQRDEAAAAGMTKEVQA
ncbi:hypothetical protein ACHAXT_007383 [Thalassiosira profunda]